MYLVTKYRSIVRGSQRFLELEHLQFDFIVDGPLGVELVVLL